MKSKYSYKWYLENTKFTKDKGKVFSCFACGGGSSFGYKLAGFDVIGFNEIDKKMAECYIKNHNPKYSFIQPIQEFKNRNDLPKELYNLDILDGSPPCSSFSNAGNREKDWGKEKKFREGQTIQILDTLFFDFIDLGKKLQPKSIIVENVKGLLEGNAKQYLGRILEAFDEANYYVDYKLLNASKMGVPQKRERVFFYAIRKDLINKIKSKGLIIKKPILNLIFDEKPIFFGEIEEVGKRKGIGKISSEKWYNCNKNGRYVTKKGETFGFIFKCNKNTVCNTITSSGLFTHHNKPETLLDNEIIKISTFPLDYDFLSNKAQYVCGMSVPPVMTAHLVDRIHKQWLIIFDK